MKHLEVFLTALRLGCTSFGGPIAHLGHFRDEYVTKRKWLSEAAYADLVALCQFLPGPASSQVGMAVGLSRAGVFGAVLAWIGFTLPSAIVLILFALGLSHIDPSAHQHWLHGLKIVAVAVVAHAVLGMGKKLCPDKTRATLALLACVLVLVTGSAMIQVAAMVIAGLFGAFFLKTSAELPHEPLHNGRRRIGVIFLVAFVALLFVLPALRALYPSHALALFDGFYRAGALVFGGGHVVLPLLQAEVIPTGWMSNDVFMAGYGVANAIPGPLFAFSAYLGAVSSVTPNSWSGGFLGLVAAFLPSFLLVVGILPFWEKLRRLAKIRQAMLGLNAAVVGILLAALYNPVWTSAIFSPTDFAIAAGAFLMLEFWKVPSWAVVAGTALLSFVAQIN